MSTADRVRESFRQQGVACRALGSKFTARLCALAGARLDTGTAVGRCILGWSGEPGGGGGALALRLAGALHHLVLTRADSSLAAVYPPNDANVGDNTLWDVCAAALVTHESAVLETLERAPQTNEVRRCNGLVPGIMAVADAVDAPLVLSELGASAGLNLLWDRYRLKLGRKSYGPADSPVRLMPQWEGNPPPSPEIEIAGRAGCDLAPVDVTDPAARLRLLSYIWPDQADRLAWTRAALDIAVREPATVNTASAGDWLSERFASPVSGCCHVVYHSIAWQYFPPDEQSRLRELMTDYGRNANDPLAWLRMEFDPEDTRSAALDLTLWPSGQERRLARVDFHGRWVRWLG